MKKAIILCAGVISAVTVANTNNGVSAATASSLSLKHNVKQNQGGGKERVLSGKKNEAAHSSPGICRRKNHPPRKEMMSPRYRSVVGKNARNNNNNSNNTSSSSSYSIGKE